MLLKALGKAKIDHHNLITPKGEIILYYLAKNIVDSNNSEKLLLKFNTTIQGKIREYISSEV